MAELHELKRPDGATKSGRRVGRGPGSGRGKTSGRGHKGHKARSGGNTKPGFEGGQMPIQRRLPKRGFHSPFRRVHEIVNVGALEALEEETITPEVLADHGLIDPGKGRTIKILGDGELDRKVTVRAHAASEGARRKIEAAGGEFEPLES